jgi:adenosylcobinamide-phosphate synthase
VGWRFLQREARRTPSPNSGWPMATMALRLRVRLGKPGVYSLNAAAAPPDSSAVQRALQAAGQAARMSVLLTVVVLLSLPWQR